MGIRGITGDGDADFLAMNRAKYLLVGGGLTASQAAKQLRKHDPDGTIVLVTQEPYVPYDRPPLSKEFLRGEISADRLAYDQQAALEEELGVQVILNTTVTDLDPGHKAAQLSQGSPIQFQTALLATGGRPRSLDVQGDSLEGVHYLRTLTDAQTLAQNAGPDRRVVIVGAGFIGMETAASLTQLGASVAVIESAQRIWARFADKTLSQFCRGYCEDKGISFYTDDTITRIIGDRRVEGVTTRSGHEIPCDVVLIAVGIVPNVDLAEVAGLELDDGIVVDAKLRTSHPDIFAGGDVVNFFDPVFEKRRRVEHWGHAEYCGQIAGRNMAGGDREYDLLSYVWSDIFDLHLEFAGDETEHDRSVLRGSPDSGAFSILYLQANRLTAYFSVNGPAKEFLPLKKLIRQQVDLTNREEHLADPTAPLRDLL